jgi:hypothetical protein
MITLDKDYRIIQMAKGQVIGSQYASVYSDTTAKSKSYVFKMVFNLSSNNALLRMVIDGEEIISDLSLRDLLEDYTYRLPKEFSYSFPVCALSSTSFMLNFPDGVEYQNLSLDFKKGGGGNIALEAGMVEMYL